MIYKYFKHIPLGSITSTIESQRNTVALIMVRILLRSILWLYAISVLQKL